MCRLVKKNNKIPKFKRGEVWCKTKCEASKSEQVAAAGTNSNTKFKWPDDLVEDLLNALRNFKVVMEFHNKDFKADKLREYEEVRKEIVKISECFNVDQFLCLCS